MYRDNGLAGAMVPSCEICHAYSIAVNYHLLLLASDIP